VTGRPISLLSYLPGSVTFSVTPFYFPLKNWRPFSSFFARYCHFHCFHSGVTPQLVSPRTFLHVRPGLSTLLCKFSHKKIYFGCHPPDGVTRAVRPPPVTPLNKLSVQYLQSHVSQVELPQLTHDQTSCR